jgi:hypothetical protein
MIAEISLEIEFPDLINKITENTTMVGVIFLLKGLF